jgi:hypothetical protein
MTGTLIDSELSARIPMSTATFYRRKRRGDFSFLEVVPQLPGPTRYSAEKVDRWLRGSWSTPGRCPAPSSWSSSPFAYRHSSRAHDGTYPHSACVHRRCKVIGCILAAFAGHTDASREDANALRDAIAAMGLKHADVADGMGLSDEKQLSRQLAGSEPLNLWRLSNLPDLRNKFDAIRAERRGAILLEPGMVALLRGLLAVGRDRLSELWPQIAAGNQERCS